MLLDDIDLELTTSQLKKNLQQLDNQYRFERVNDDEKSGAFFVDMGANNWLQILVYDTFISNIL